MFRSSELIWMVEFKETADLECGINKRHGQSRGGLVDT